MNKLTTYALLCTEFYDREPHPNAHEAELFYLQQAQTAHGAILEPMCGTGRFLIPMLQAGLPAEGFDASPYMLDACITKCATLGISHPPVWQQFVEDFTSDKRYAMIFVPYGSWGLIHGQAASAAGLTAMYQHLSLGGKLFLEIETLYSVSYPLDVWRSSEHRRDDGSRLIIHLLPSYNPITQLFSAECRYESIIGNTIVATETEQFTQYLYRFDEMDALLTAAGFSHISKYSDYNKSLATDPTTATLIYECIK